MSGAIRQAEILLSKVDHSYSLQQFKNSANPRTHYLSTGPEIWEQTKGKVGGIEGDQGGKCRGFLEISAGFWGGDQGEILGNWMKFHFPSLPPI